MHDFSISLDFQLPQPVAKPAKYDERSFEDALDSFVKSEPVKMKRPTSNLPIASGSNESTASVKKENDSSLWDFYKEPAKNLPSQSGDLFSRLNETVKVSSSCKNFVHSFTFHTSVLTTFQSIDFNNMNNYGQVTIHKRNRLSPPESSQSLSPETTNNDSTAPKRKKYKIVPNTLTTTGDYQSVSIDSNDGNDDDENTENFEASQLPSDRKELLKFVRTKLFGVYVPSI